MKAMAQWSIYLIIGNLNHEIRRLWKTSKRMMVSLISIYIKDFFEIIMEIYYQTMKIITKDIFESLSLYMVVCLETVLDTAVVENI